ncbi:MAG: ROK family protein [Chloroflexi bacterium]|nr:ROK family protein [Chloroflexota bacterium]
MSACLAIDFGGTRSRAALFDREMRLLRRAETRSRVSDGPDIVLDRLIALGKSLTEAGGEPASIGIAAPGPLDTAAGVIIQAETLPGWSQVPIGETLSRAFAGLPAFVENDANLGALAEYHLGAGQGADPMIYLTISTGIGGGAIVNGELFTGANGHAIEPGHMRLTQHDGRIRRWEELASGTALGELARHRLSTSPAPSVLRESDAIDGRAVGEAALAGDEFALDCLRQAGTFLGLGLVNLLHLFNPAAFVMGGSVMKLGDLILEPARKAIEQHILFEGFLPENLLRPARFGDDVCLVGAALHARQFA